MATHLTVEEYKRVSGHDIKNDAELKALLEQEPEDMAGETITALGAGHQVGDIYIPPLTAGVLPLLELIDSPFIKEDETEYGQMAVMSTLYVLINGRAAVLPVMGIARRRNAMAKHKHLASQSPEHFAVYLAACDAIEQEWEVFDNTVAAYFETLGPFDLQGVAEAIVASLNDAMQGFAALPTDGGDEKKTGR